MSDALTREECQIAIDAYAAMGPEAQKYLNKSRDQLFRLRKKALEFGLTPKDFGSLSEKEVIDYPLPERGKVSRYILTSAQSTTKAFNTWWRNLVAYANDVEAEIMVGRMRYNKTTFQMAREKDDGTADNEVWYAKQIEPYICDDRVRLCEGLIWVGDMNAMPTAANPLSGLDSFGGHESCIFPHTKVALRSVPTHPSLPCKMLFTTGAVTQLNYIQRKEGLKAEFHHAFAALLVEVDSDGNWFARHLNAGKDGAFYDLNAHVKGGKVKHGNFVKVMVAGDIHARNVNREVFDTVWGEGGFVDIHQPKMQVLHDLLDFESKSHHNTFFDEYELHVKGRDSVEDEIEETFKLLEEMERPNLKTYVVSANHNDHLDKWLQLSNLKADMVNAPFYLEAMGAKLRSIREGKSNFHLLEWALARHGKSKAKFLGRRDSLVIDGVRLDQHFDIGANGSRGSAQQFAKSGDKATGGHSHSAGIFDGAYQVGTFSELLLDYVLGLSSWSHTFCVQYPNGKRALITIKNGKYRA